MFHVLALALSAFALRAADFHVPALIGPVMDEARMLQPATRESLAQFLVSFAQKGGAQLQIFTVPDLGGLSIEEASIQTTDKWKLGKKKEDRGVLLMIAAAEHRVRIEVGQGLEGDLPDATANRIIREVIVPRMRQGAPDRAVADAVAAILHYTDPQLLATVQDQGTGVQPAAPHSRHSPLGRLFTILFWIFMLLLFLRNPSGFFLYSLLGGFGGGRGGGFGGGGSSDDHWSGGGGGFSGGGASGDW